MATTKWWWAIQLCAQTTSVNTRVDLCVSIHPHYVLPSTSGQVFEGGYFKKKLKRVYYMLIFIKTTRLQKISVDVFIFLVCAYFY